MNTVHIFICLSNKTHQLVEDSKWHYCQSTGLWVSDCTDQPFIQYYPLKATGYPCKIPFEECN